MCHPSDNFCTFWVTAYCIKCSNHCKIQTVRKSAQTLSLKLAHYQEMITKTSPLLRSYSVKQITAINQLRDIHFCVILCCQLPWDFTLRIKIPPIHHLMQKNSITEECVRVRLSNNLLKFGIQSELRRSNGLHCVVWPHSFTSELIQHNKNHREK